MIKKIILMVVLGFLFILCSQAYAATYYMANNPGPGGQWESGSNSNNGLTKASPFLTMRYATSKMKSGDTLIIADGTYTGSDNMIDPYGAYGGCPPEGSPGAYTTVKAENTGKVILDGQGQRRTILIRGNDAVDGRTGSSPSHDYIEIRGIVAANSSEAGIAVVYCNHIKLINVGAVDPADGNISGIAVNYSSYVLLEGGYAWGAARYKISSYHSNHCIFRNCVTRFDRGNAYSSGPMGGICIYSSTNMEVQNCIDIDGGPREYWQNYNGMLGSFAAPTTSDSEYRGPIHFTNVIALNNKMRFGSLEWNAYPADTYFRNSVGWDIETEASTDLIHSQGKSNFDHCTFGEINNENNNVLYAYYNGWKGDPNVVKNSIFYNFKNGNLFYDIETINFNNIYGLSSDKSIISNGPSDQNTIAIDPTKNGLTYLTEIESDSILDTSGENGTYIGAKIRKMYGKPGTLWGEEGYNLLQDGKNGQSNINLWPFPQEETIREHMRSYSYDNGKLSGKRGFCSDGQSLTKYIWEYLGGQIPDDIYGSGGITVAPTTIYKVETRPSE